jgi:hypothetical protein
VTFTPSRLINSMGGKAWGSVNALRDAIKEAAANNPTTAA